MSSGSTMRRIGSAAVAGAAALTALAPAASAAGRPAAPAPVGAAEQSLTSKLTVTGYLQYLASRHTPEAKRTLKAFRALPKAKQQKFVGYLQNRKVYQALTASLKGTTRPGGLRRAAPYNPDVSFVKEVRVETKGKVAGAVNTRVGFAMSEEIFGIPVTTEKVWVQYLAKGGRATQLKGGGATVTNVNAAVDIKGGGTPRLFRGAATLSATWKATPRYASFGKGLDKLQALDAGVQGYWRASLHNA
ncbi:hypothetical protein HEK616_61950 [Streptomyces nigrescens]|uniref:Uncharacterized protein n=2 Tax=Streptomyces TaxID=1883 RepID=A0ABN6R6G9_STRNI|nr:hypothetical protein [Streptomyces nigrescens]MEE4421186.1 hypothetical protein [Streptomyces sp. DSM 41528]BDM72708.1 hypothetical protein HEK616_61950 [Streptomyces nigrescens]